MKDDKKFGVPEQKKFPLYDADHVISAIKFFNYVDRVYEKQLAKAILRRAKEYGVDISEMNIGDNNRFKKYVPVNELKHKGIKGWTKKNHKYTSRFLKNGKWFYVYKTDGRNYGKRYNRLEDWLGMDERDAAHYSWRDYDSEMDFWKYVKSYKDNPEYYSDEHPGTKYVIDRELKDTSQRAIGYSIKYEKKLREYYKTPIGKVEKSLRKTKLGSKFIEKYRHDKLGAKRDLKSHW